MIARRVDACAQNFKIFYLCLLNNMKGLPARLFSMDEFRMILGEVLKIFSVIRADVRMLCVDFCHASNFGERYGLPCLRTGQGYVFYKLLIINELRFAQISPKMK